MRLFRWLRRGLGFDGPEPGAKPRDYPETGTDDPRLLPYLTLEASDRIWRAIVAEIECECRWIECECSCHWHHDRQDAEAIA